MESKIAKLFRELDLGEIETPILPVSGGLMHRMYKVVSEGHAYAVKALNPEILARPEARANYEKAEALEAMIEEAGIPIVPAKVFRGKKMQGTDGQFFYIFDWLEGSITDWNHTSVEQCYTAGNVLGRMHAIDPKDMRGDESYEPEIEESHIDWDGFIAEAEKCGSDIAPLLSDKKELLEYAERELNKARRALPPIECISDEDMDPKNIMWKDGKPYVIDLECLDRGNPVSHVLQLALQWSGITILDLDISHVKAFFDGYLAAYDNGFRKYDEVFGLAYTWLEWLEYNISRALGKCIDEDERKMGVSEVENTINRIGYITSMEEDIKSALRKL